MTIYHAKAKKVKGKDEWYVICPSCGEKFYIEGHPAPGGMEYNAEFCPYCGVPILIEP